MYDFISPHCTVIRWKRVSQGILFVHIYFLLSFFFYIYKTPSPLSWVIKGTAQLPTDKDWPFLSVDRPIRLTGRPLVRPTPLYGQQQSFGWVVCQGKGRMETTPQVVSLGGVYPVNSFFLFNVAKDLTMRKRFRKVKRRNTFVHS